MSEHARMLPYGIEMLAAAVLFLAWAIAATGKVLALREELHREQARRREADALALRIARSAAKLQDELLAKAAEARELTRALEEATAWRRVPSPKTGRGS